eukprot:731629-Amphidinium_carterae.1
MSSMRGTKTIERVLQRVAPAGLCSVPRAQGQPTRQHGRDRSAASKGTLSCLHRWRRQSP